MLYVFGVLGCNLFRSWFSVGHLFVVCRVSVCSGTFFLFTELSRVQVATTLEAIELNYLSHGVFRLYEDLAKPCTLLFLLLLLLPNSFAFMFSSLCLFCRFSLSKLFHNQSSFVVAGDDPLRFYVNVQFSPGAALDPFIFAEPDHLLPGVFLFCLGFCCAPVVRAFSLLMC